MFKNLRKLVKGAFGTGHSPLDILKGMGLLNYKDKPAGTSFTKRGPGRKHYKGSGEEGLPSGYPGAKLARKFINKTATIRHGKYTTGAI